jgi:hypothetical protein
MSYDTVVAADSPTGWWKLTDAAGSATLADSSGNASPMTTGSGFSLGSAATIPGSTGTCAVVTANGTATVESKAAYTPVLPYTSEIWVNTTNINTTGGSYAESEMWLMWFGGYGFLLFEHTDGQAGAFQYVGAPTNLANGIPIADGKWHHVVGVWTASTISLYVDGGMVSSTALNSTAINGQWYIGSYGTSVGQAFAGNLAHAAWYNKALTTNQIASHYQAGIAATVATPAKRMRLLALTTGGQQVKLGSGLAASSAGTADTITFNGPLEYGDGTAVTINTDEYLPIVVDPDKANTEEIWVTTTPDGSYSSSCTRGQGSSTGAPTHATGALVVHGPTPYNSIAYQGLYDDANHSHYNMGDIVNVPGFGLCLCIQQNPPSAYLAPSSVDDPSASASPNWQYNGVAQYVSGTGLRIVNNQLTQVGSCICKIPCLIDNLDFSVTVGTATGADGFAIAVLPVTAGDSYSMGVGGGLGGIGGLTAFGTRYENYNNYGGFQYNGGWETSYTAAAPTGTVYRHVTSSRTSTNSNPYITLYENGVYKWAMGMGMLITTAATSPENTQQLTLAPSHTTPCYLYISAASGGVAGTFVFTNVTINNGTFLNTAAWQPLSFRLA